MGVAVPDALARWRDAAPFGRSRAVWFERGRWRRAEFRFYDPGIDKPLPFTPQPTGGAGLWG